MINFHPLEVVGRGSETQRLVGENLNSFFLGLRVKGTIINISFHRITNITKEIFYQILLWMLTNFIDTFILLLALFSHKCFSI